MDTHCDASAFNLPRLDPLVDEGGFLRECHTWTPKIAEALALRCGIAPLSDPQWEVIRFLRHRYLRLGVIPAMRTVIKSTGSSRIAIAALFGDAHTLVKVAGLPDPGEEARSHMD